MYQDVLDALHASKTTRQHINAMEKLHKNCAADPDLQKLIYAFGSQLQEWLSSVNKLAKQKNPNGTINQLSAAKAKAVKAQAYIPSAPPTGTLMHPTVAALLTYCKSKI